MNSERSNLKTRIGFGICDLGGNLFFTLVGFYIMNFVTDVALLGAGLAGTVLMIGKICDAGIDPLIGYLSDKTSKRMGRRRPWMLAGALSVFIMMIIMFTNPGIKNQVLLFFWILVIYCLMVTANSMIAIPYGALTPEITSGYDDRTVLNAFRMSFALAGSLIAAGLAMVIVGMFSDKNTGWTVMGSIMGAIVSVTALITVFTIKEKRKSVAAINGKTSIFKSWASAVKNRPFMMVVITFACHITGTSIIQGTLIYYFKYIYGGEGSLIIAMMCLMIPCFIFIPVWTAVSRYLGKKNVYNLGMGIVAAAIVVIYFFAEKYGPAFMYLIMAISSIGFSTHYVMPNTLVPDTTDLDYTINKKRREGVFYGIWNFTMQVGQAFANAIIGWTLYIFGYVANVEQTPLARTGIKLLIGPVSIIFILAGIITLSFYPITRKYYETQIAPKVAELDRGSIDTDTMLKK